MKNTLKNVQAFYESKEGSADIGYGGYIAKIMVEYTKKVKENKSNIIKIAVSSIRSNFEMWREGKIKDGAFSWHLQNNLLLIEKELIK